MDEGLLNDLLECSVCLERLDTSSRVLPCQHTFCLKCLKVIVESHKELRCPECRVLVEAKVEELPPNVLLMRILEGMKNSAPRKTTAVRGTRSGVSQTQTQQGVQLSRSDGKQLPPHARAIYDYISKEPGDLSFKKGDTVLLLKKLDPFWYQGETSGRTGMFPITYVQVAIPLPVPTALCKALYDFRMSAPDEEGCLAFDKGAIITVHRRVDENWAEGRLEQRIGIFPIAFVELNQPARQLMTSAPLNRSVPPVPEHSRTAHGDHRHHPQGTAHSHRYQQMSISTPTNVQSNYQNMAPMSQSHPNYAQMLPQSQILVPQQVSQLVSGCLVTTTAVPRTIIDPTQTKHSLDLIHFNMHNKQGTVALQSVSRIGENYDRVRAVKFDNYNSTPVHKVETTYQNVRTEHFPVSVASFNSNNISSDSSSSMNTPVGVSLTTTPNSSNTSSSESAEPSLPSSPDNNTDRNTTVIAMTQEEPTVENLDASLNTSMGVLSLNESSTATNTSLNVSLPPAESPQLNTTSASTSNQVESEIPSISTMLDTPSSSKNRPSGPESILNFGLGLQAALSPSHSKDGSYLRHREHHREKRHSLTPSTHLQGNHSTQNRHSAEILATSLLDHATEQRSRADRDRSRDRERRRRRSRSNEQPLPAAYVALYPYKPHKPDELELRKGAIYTVTERCRDGWYKGCSERSRRCGVFPGNYVAPRPGASTRPSHDKTAANPTTTNVKPTQAVVATSSASAPATAAAPAAAPAPPDAPPRANSPTQPVPYPWSSQSSAQLLQTTPRSDKSKDKSKAEKSSIASGVSLMKRLAAMKKCKSPPPCYSMDNPVFEDGPGPSLLLNAPHHPVHVRSGSCPSQLLRSLPATERLRHKERPSILGMHEHRHPQRAVNEGPWQTQHRKSQSLDVTATARKDRHHTQPLKERFRCVVPYPPNSEYELELKVDDIVVVSRKRGDGWYKGTLQRTGRSGLFPASFVQRCADE